MKKVAIYIGLIVLLLFGIYIIYISGTQNRLTDIYDSIVYIESLNERSSTTGAGFVYKIENNKVYIITCYHVVDKSDEIYIYDINKNKSKAVIFNYNELSDIAVIVAENNLNLKEATIVDSNKIKLADEIYALGTPLNFDYVGTLTKGIVSFVNRKISLTTIYGTNEFEAIQIDAETNLGNSGGPLLNNSGKVIGMMFLKEEQIDGISFALPINYVIDIVEKLEK